MKIGIQTLRLHSNYGGILQAYALQTVLQRMGHEVYVINKVRQWPTLPRRGILAYANRFVKKYFFGNKKVFIFWEQKRKSDYLTITQYTQPFIDKYINVLDCKEFSDLPRCCFNAIVVGSDQIWRPIYFSLSGNIVDAYLNFARDWDIKRVSYAASFGTSEWEYSPEETDVCKELISMFDAVSVREDSAVKLCEEHFGVEAKHLLDPTMLLQREDYVSLVRESDVEQSSGDLLVYLLDESDDKNNLVDLVAKSMGLISFVVNSKVENPDAPIEDKIQPPLEKWLRGFMDAKFVVADSFHACVFSIIFNIPFIAYGNIERGSARFSSLLKMFGLEDRLIYSLDELDVERFGQIDWERVNRRLEELRQVSYEFLDKNLK